MAKPGRVRIIPADAPVRDIRTLDHEERMKDAAHAIDLILERKMTRNEADSIDSIEHSPTSGVVAVRFNGPRKVAADVFAWRTAKIVVDVLRARGFIVIDTKCKGPHESFSDEHDWVVIIPERYFGINVKDEASEADRNVGGDVDDDLGLGENRTAINKAL